MTGVVFDRLLLSEVVQWSPIAMVIEGRIVWPTVAPLR